MAGPKALPQLLLLVVLSTGCSADGPAETRDLLSTVRDSAQIVVIENRVPEAGSRLDWRLSPNPVLSVGALDGDPDYLLFQVRAATQLPDGRLLVVNRGTSEIRVFDASGTYLSSWGGAGEGPGEFASVTDVALWSSDSVMAWDSQLSRVSIFDMDGTYQRSFSLATDRELGPRQYEALLSDGSILGTTPLSFGAEDGSNGIVRPRRGYARMGRAGDLLADLGQYPGTEAYMRSTSSNVAVLPLPFARSTVAAAWQGRILISPNDRYEIRGYGPTGQLEMILRREHEPLAVSREHIETHLREQRDRLDEAEYERFAASVRELPTVESLPAFSDVRVDALDYLWVNDYAEPGVEPTLWTVFDPAGRIRGFFQTPSGREILEIGSDYLLARTTDDLDVEFVEKWRLDRSGR